MKNNTKKTLGYFLQFSLKYKYSGFFMLASVTAASAIAVLLPWYYKLLFDGLGADDRQGIIKLLLYYLAIIAALSFVEWIFWRLSTFVANRFYSKVMTDLVNHCYAYLLNHSFSYFNNNFVGSLVKKVKWFGRSFEVIADRVTWNFLPLITNLVIIFIVLCFRNLWLSLMVGAWVVIFLAVNYGFATFKLKYDILRSEAETETTGYLADTITNNTTVKLFNGYKREVTGFAQISDKLRKLRRFTWDLDATFEAIQGFLMISLELGIFYAALIFWSQGKLTIGDFALIQMYLVQIFHRVWEFGRNIRHIYEALSDAAEMTAILETPHEIKDIPRAKKIQVSKGVIEFRDTTFYYHQTRPILENFNLTIRPREHVAIIGPSGAGKTTIVKLILRMYDLSSGGILIDGQDIAKVTQESLWQSVSYVPQDPILFHRPLIDNIRYGLPSATDREVIKAAKLAHCHEFISQFPDGYNTYVGERGVKLSGGERQRVAIARAILRNAPILVLDEATSSLDSESEELIQDALDKLMAGKTVIIIAHRLSTIRKMDRIIVVDEGCIIEQGSHQDLLAQNSGIYKKLWRLQAGGFIQ